MPQYVIILPSYIHVSKRVYKRTRITIMFSPVQPCERGLSLVQLSHEFMATWTSFYSLLEKQFAASSAKSFGKRETLTLISLT